jgi:hypothetical protein
MNMNLPMAVTLCLIAAWTISMICSKVLLNKALQAHKQEKTDCSGSDILIGLTGIVVCAVPIASSFLIHGYVLWIIPTDPSIVVWLKKIANGSNWALFFFGCAYYARRTSKIGLFHTESR